MFPPFAQAAAAGTVAHWLIVAVVVAAIVAVAVVFLRQSGVAVPGWLVQVFWIVVFAVVAVVAIRFLLTLL